MLGSLILLFATQIFIECLVLLSCSVYTLATYPLIYLDTSRPYHTMLNEEHDLGTDILGLNEMLPMNTANADDEYPSYLRKLYLLYLLYVAKNSCF